MQRAEHWRRMAAAEDREAIFAAIAVEIGGAFGAHAPKMRNVRDKIDSVDMLQELAQAHGLVRQLGNDRVQELIARGWR